MAFFPSCAHLLFSLEGIWNDWCNFQGGRENKAASSIAITWPHKWAVACKPKQLRVKCSFAAWLLISKHNYKKISKLKTEKTTTNNQVVRQAGGRFLNYNMPCTQVKYAVQQGSQQRNQVWIYFCYLGCSFSKKQRNSLRSVYTPATTNRW